jgi:hypothetical protein
MHILTIMVISWAYGALSKVTVLQKGMQWT